MTYLGVCRGGDKFRELKSEVTGHKLNMGTGQNQTTKIWTARFIQCTQFQWVPVWVASFDPQD